MKTNTKSILIVALVLISVGVVSCKKYLDRSPAASISDDEPFINFRNFQGFTEELYYCVPDMCHPDWTGDWNMADDEIPSTNGQGRISWQFDQGNYQSWTSGGSWLNDPSGANTQFDEGKNKGLWPLAWYGIRKANMGLANLDKMVGTQEEKDFIKGQLLFFRGWFHFELMIYWGGLPYIDKVLSPTDKLELPRLKYRETALLAAKDFEDAAALLPANWDKTTVGQVTLNNNNGRVTKSAALGFLGKDLLYAASPLMNEVSGGTATYDTELCKKAADAFTQVFKLSDNGDAYYKLMPFNTWSNIWYVVGRPVKTPGFPETIFAPPVFAVGNTHFGLVCQFIPSAIGGDSGVSVIAANYVNYFGMANGLPITDPASGYTTADPWTNRDPRFYKTVITDGERMVTKNDPEATEYRFATLYTGGKYRDEAGASRTGYLTRKFVDGGANKYDATWDNFATVMPYMRLADVYLMYAEAVLQGYGSPSSAAPGNNMSAVDAVNVIRNRATVPNVDPKFLVSKDVFMDQIIRERAVELALEGHRWLDLRRWKKAGNPEYLQKTAIDFDRGPNGKPINLRERVLITRVFEKKHEWLPLPTNQVNLYPAFGQNPGW